MWMLGESFYPIWLSPAPAPALWSLGLCFPAGRLLLLQEGQTRGCAGSCSVVAHHCPSWASQAKGPSLISRIFPAPPATHPPAHLPHAHAHAVSWLHLWQVLTARKCPQTPQILAHLQMQRTTLLSCSSSWFLPPPLCPGPASLPCTINHMVH